MVNPLIDQYQLQQTSFWCGPAAVRDALTCLGVLISQSQLAAELGTTTAGTDSSADVVRVMNQHLGPGAYSARYIPGNDATAAEQATLKASLVSSIDAGYPLVCNVVGTIRALDGGSYSYPGGHYVSVIGYRDGGDEALVADIAARKYWTTTARLGTWIAERGYSHPALAVGPAPTRTGEGVDYSFSPPSATGLAAAGKSFAGRYVGPGSGKFLTPAERDALFAAGLDIFLLVEGAAGDAAGGYGVGVVHAQLALAHARALGAPDSAALYFAIDYDVSSNGWDAPREYLRGAGSVIGAGRVGVYGEADVMAWAQRDGVAAWFFQTYAWSAGAWFKGNHVEQYRNGVPLAGGEVDLCRSRQANFGQWVRPGGSIPAPIEEDEEMHTVRSGASDGSIYFVPGYAAPSGKLAAFGLDGPRSQSYGNAGVKQVQLPDGMTVGGSGIYDIDPQPWPAGSGGGGVSGPVTVAAESVSAIADAVIDEIAS